MPLRSIIPPALNDVLFLPELYSLWVRREKQTASFLSIKKWYHLTIPTISLILTPRLCTQDGKTIPHLKAKRTSFQQNIIFTLKKSTH